MCPALHVVKCALWTALAGLFRKFFRIMNEVPTVLMIGIAFTKRPGLL